MCSTLICSPLPAKRTPVNIAICTHRLKHAWMYKDERLFLENKAAEMELPSIEEQANPPPKPLQVDPPPKPLQVDPLLNPCR